MDLPTDTPVIPPLTEVGRNEWALGIHARIVLDAMGAYMNYRPIGLHQKLRNLGHRYSRASVRAMLHSLHESGFVRPVQVNSNGTVRRWQRIAFTTGSA